MGNWLGEYRGTFVILVRQESPALHLLFFLGEMLLKKTTLFNNSYCNSPTGGSDGGIKRGTSANPRRNDEGTMMMQGKEGVVGGRGSRNSLGWMNYKCNLMNDINYSYFIIIISFNFYCYWIQEEVIKMMVFRR